MMKLLVVDSSAMAIRSKDHPLVPSTVWGLRRSPTGEPHQAAHSFDGENTQCYRDHEVWHEVLEVSSGPDPWLTSVFERGL